MSSVWPTFFPYKDVYVYGTEYKKDSAWTKIVAWVGYEAVSVKEVRWESLFEQHMCFLGVCFVIHFFNVRVYTLVQTSGTYAKKKERRKTLEGEKDSAYVSTKVWIEENYCWFILATVL